MSWTGWTKRPRSMHSKKYLLKSDNSRSPLFARKKLTNMASHVGFPVELIDMAKLNEYFGDLEMKPDKFFDNSAQISRWRINSFLGKLREKVNKTDWKSHAEPFDINAMFIPAENAIGLPARILQVVAYCIAVK